MTQAAYGALFDMDGVLVDSSEAHFRAWNLLGEELGQPFSRELFERTFGMHNAQIFPLWLGARTASLRGEELSRRKELLYRTECRELIQPLAGAPELVRELAAAGFRLAVGSSGPRLNVDLALKVLGVTDLFHGLSTAEDVTRGKPDPQVFTVAATRLDLPARRCVVVEDAPQGVAAGRAAGCRVVAVTSTRPAAELEAADLIVEALGEVNSGRLRALLDEGPRPR